MRVCYTCEKAIDPKEMKSGLHKECFCEWFHLLEPHEFKGLVARSNDNSDDDEDWQQINTSFFHGKFRKYSAHLGDRSYLLKVVQSEYPELPVTEYLCNQLASLLGVEVPDYYMILFQNKLETFVVRNFMENRPGSDLVHIYRYCDEPKDYNCEYLLRVIEKEVGRYDPLRRFIELCLFDALIGNHDRHGRNLGLIQEPSGASLAPFYDNPCYLALEIPELLGADHEPRGAIRTFESQNPTMKDYVKEWKRLGFNKEVEKFAACIQLKKIEELVTTSFLSEKRKEAVFRLIKKRYKELLNAI